MSIRGWFVRRLIMPTKLLNDDGTASIATAIMSSHHAFRRDLACFAKALANDQRDGLNEEWGKFRGALHGHHTSEDTGVFPALLAEHPELASEIEVLDAQHRVIDPLLERGDRAFADLRIEDALAIVRELERLLDEHLELEERIVIPHLRGANQFPPPPNDEALSMYADGFAWSTAGLAPAVVEQIYAMLPSALAARIPAARRAFDARCTRTWGYVHED